MVDECLPSQAEAMAASLLDTLHLPSPTNGNHSNGAGKLRHAVMVPYPVQGQINPMLHLAKTLAKEHNFIITFVNNEHNHKRMIHAENRSKSSSTNPDSHQSNIRFVWVDNGLPPDFDYNDHADLSLRAQFFKACDNMKYPLKDLVESLNQEKPPVTFIVSGFLCYWAHSVAVELHIPSVFLWPQSAAVFSIFYHTPKLVSNGFFPYKKTDPGCSNDLVSYIPGVPPLHPAELPTFLHVDDISQPIFQIVKAQFDIVESCDAIIINSFEELEKDACEALRTELSSRVSFVGPLLPSAFIDDGSLLHEKNDCIKWLDNKQEQSVLYVSFGSMFNPSAEDLQGIALGIKASKRPFLWAIRPEASSQNVSEILPENFLEDTKDYGLIIPWAPQLQVLSHPSVAAFLTHCGWNSTLESLSQGVPMIPFPLLVDQPTNCKFLVDIWKVGMSIKKRPDHDGKVESEEVERVVRIVLQGEEGKEMRRRAGKLKDAARRAVQAQGTSNAHMEKFIKAMTRDA